MGYLKSLSLTSGLFHRLFLLPFLFCVKVILSSFFVIINFCDYLYTLDIIVTLLIVFPNFQDVIVFACLFGDLTGFCEIYFLCNVNTLMSLLRLYSPRHTYFDPKITVIFSKTLFENLFPDLSV